MDLTLSTPLTHPLYGGPPPALVQIYTTAVTQGKWKCSSSSSSSSRSSSSRPPTSGADATLHLLTHPVGAAEASNYSRPGSRLAPLLTTHSSFSPPRIYLTNLRLTSNAHSLNLFLAAVALSPYVFNREAIRICSPKS